MTQRVCSKCFFQACIQIWAKTFFFFCSSPNFGRKIGPSSSLISCEWSGWFWVEQFLIQMLVLLKVTEVPAPIQQPYLVIGTVPLVRSRWLVITLGIRQKIFDKCPLYAIYSWFKCCCVTQLFRVTLLLFFILSQYHGFKFCVFLFLYLSWIMCIEKKWNNLALFNNVYEFNFAKTKWVCLKRCNIFQI